MIPEGDEELEPLNEMVAGAAEALVGEMLKSATTGAPPPTTMTVVPAPVWPFESVAVALTV